MRQVVLSGIVVLGGALPSAASTADPTGAFTSAWVVGDSLSDDGNLFAATSANPFAEPTPASPPYFEGRFSNGPVWAEALTGAFEDRGKTAENAAFGGARTEGGDVPDLGEQLDLVALGAPRFGDRPVATLWLGANDLFDAIPVSAEAAEATALAAAARIGAGIDRLETLGFRDVILFNLPDLGGTPLYSSAGSPLAPLGGRATIATGVFNAALDAVIDAEDGVSVSLVDIASLFEELRDDPALFGVTDRFDVSCLDPFTAVPCTPAKADDLAFFDPVHPSAEIHAAIAREALATLAAAAPQPVPLPAGLPLALAAFAALGALRVASRRR